MVFLWAWIIVAGIALREPPKGRWVRSGLVISTFHAVLVTNAYCKVWYSDLLFLFSYEEFKGIWCRTVQRSAFGWSRLLRTRKKEGGWQEMTWCYVKKLWFTTPQEQISSNKCFNNVQLSLANSTRSSGRGQAGD